MAADRSWRRSLFSFLSEKIVERIVGKIYPGGIMLKRTFAFLMVSFFIGLGSTQAEMISRAADYQIIIDTFFDLMSKGDADAAGKYIFSSNPSFKNQKASVKETKKGLKEISETIGEYIKTERLGEKKIAEGYIYVYYIAHYEFAPVLILFEFYKPTDEWIVQSFGYDSQIYHKYGAHVLFEVMKGDGEK